MKTTAANPTTTNLSTPLAGIDPHRLESAVDRLVTSQRPRYRRLWAYYRNPMRLVGLADATATPGAERPYRQAQEWGLPPRITGVLPGAEPFADAGLTGRARKEVVVENDIAWRVDTSIEYLFGKPVVISSQAPDPKRRDTITQLLAAILEHNGGLHFLQQIALLGAIHGFVDIMVKLDTTAAIELAQQTKPSPDAPTVSGTPDDAGLAPSPGPDRGPAPACSDLHQPAGTLEVPLSRLARLIHLEIIEPARALPLVCPNNWRALQAYAQVWEVDRPDSPAPPVPSRWWEKVRSILLRDHLGSQLAGERGQTRIIELVTPTQWLRLQDGRLTAQGANSLGEIPVVHIQNLAEVQSYSGGSDVEPLIPLQDELNTRLSDRAHRITLQSFKMYLGKGLEQFTDQPVAPGRMWMTDNEQADITEFGGDSNCPSEDAHIADLREALDKTSGVTPIAAGAIKNRIGRLTSAAALRITLLALLSKTDRKRALFGAGLAKIAQLALKWLDTAGLFTTQENERQIELNWPSPLPENSLEKLQEAEAKLRLGVARETVLRELGY